MAAREGLQGVGEVLPLFVGQTGDDLGFVGFGKLSEGGEGCAAVVCEVELVVAPVGGAACPGKQSPPLEGVDDIDDPAGYGADPVGDGALAESGRAADEAEHGRLARGEGEVAHAVGEA